MSNVPRLNRWTAFVKSLGGRVCLDVAWEEKAWAEFGDYREGDLDVVCRLGADGDLDVTSPPRLEGESVREHSRLPQALAALAYVNPAATADGQPVCKRSHRGDWYAINDGLAVAVALGGDVGGVDTGGQGAFLVLKGRLWLPYGPQEAAESVPEATVDAGETPEPEQAAMHVEEGPVEAAPERDNVHAFPSSRGRKPRQQRGRIFGEEADELIRQSRSRRKRA